MSTTVWIVAGAVVLAVVVAWRVLAPTLDRHVSRALSSGDAQPLVEHLLGLAEAARPNAFNHAIRRLWDAYERELAVPLVLALAEHHAETKIAQYWLDQLRTVEPELARQAFEGDFLERHYKPKVAAQCGNAG